MAVTFRDSDGTTRLSGDLLASGGATGDVLTQQANGSFAPAAGGAPGAPVVRGPFPFAFNTAGLNNGVSFYVPTVGDVLLDGWIRVVTAFNGTTPKADFSQYTGTNNTWGLFGWSGINVSLDFADTLDNGGGPLSGTDTIDKNRALSVASGTTRPVPAIFTTADPLLVVASQNGQKGGAAVGGAAGLAHIYIVTATPVAP